MGKTLRRTKIVATLGPASSDRETLRRLIQAGVDVVRLNFSHGTAKDHVKTAGLVRDIAVGLNRTVGVLADLQGPKIRIRGFKSSTITLEEGKPFIIDPSVATQDGSLDRVGITYPSLAEDVASGSLLLLDDGKYILEVQKDRKSVV